MASTTVTVAALQTSRVTGDKGANVEVAVESIRRAAADGARLMGLPELFSTEYFPQDIDAKYFEYAETIPGPTTDAIERQCRELDVWVVAPVFEVDADTRVFYNSAALVGPGGVAMRYRKRHIPVIAYGVEKAYFAPGNLGYPVYETPHGSVGILICYDRHFPECYRHLALGGAEIVFTCANSPTEFSRRNWIPEMMVNATSNGIFIVQTNVVGVEDHHTFFGLSSVVGPRGDLLGQLSDSEPGVLTVDVNLDDIRRARMHYGAIRDAIWSDFGLSDAQSPFDVPPSAQDPTR